MSFCRPEPVVLAVAAMIAFREPVGAADDILYSSEVTQMPLVCRATAMGDAAVALPLNGSFGYWNPAIPSLLPKYEVWVEGAKLYGGMSSQGMVSFTAPVQDGMAVGLLYSPFFPGDITRNDTLPSTYLDRLNNESLRADGSGLGVFHNNQSILQASVSKNFVIPAGAGGVNLPAPLNIAGGVNAKGVWQTMDPDGTVRMAMDVNIDLGLLVSLGVDFDLAKNRVVRQVCFGAAMQNALPTETAWLNSPDNYTEPVHNTQYYGLSYIDDEGFGWITWKAAVALQRTWTREQSSGYESSYHYGIEVGLWDVADIRAGLSDGVVTLGAGLHYRNFFVDYSFRFDEVEYSPLRLAVGAAF